MNKLKMVLVFCIFLLSCSGEEYPEVCLDDICIGGEWEWVESYGSIAGLTITPESENETRKLIITETHYQEFVNDEKIVDLEYEYIISDELTSFNIDNHILKLEGSNWYVVLEENENLVLREACEDCWNHTYRRK